MHEEGADFVSAASGNSAAAERIWLAYDDGARYFLGRKLKPGRVTQALRQVQRTVVDALMQGRVDRAGVAGVIRMAMDEAVRSQSEGGRLIGRTVRPTPSAREMLLGLFRDFSPAEVLALSRFYLDGCAAERICGELEIDPRRFAGIQQSAKERYLRVFHAKTRAACNGLGAGRTD